MNREQKIKSILNEAPHRIEALRCVADLEFPNCYIAGGFIRNAVWDALYQKTEPAMVNDIDVVYFKPLSDYGLSEKDIVDLLKAGEMNPVWEEEEQAEKRLRSQMPEFKFEVKNQARMHLSPVKTHAHAQYRSLEEALSDWVETSTPVGARLIPGGLLEIIAPQGTDDLFSGILRATRPEYESRLRERAKTKGWLQRWPKLSFGDSRP